MCNFGLFYVAFYRPGEKSISIVLDYVNFQYTVKVTALQQVVIMLSFNLTTSCQHDIFNGSLPEPAQSLLYIHKYVLGFRLKS